jgi:hypothetical protein
LTVSGSKLSRSKGNPLGGHVLLCIEMLYPASCVVRRSQLHDSSMEAPRFALVVHSDQTKRNRQHVTGGSVPKSTSRKLAPPLAILRPALLIDQVEDAIPDSPGEHSIAHDV